MGFIQHNFDYDLLVIGSGPAGQKAAIQAAKLGRRVAVIERKSVLGGVSVNTGTIPSKTLREAVIDLSGYREREFYGLSYAVKHRITIQDLLQRVESVIRHEIDVMRHQLLRNRVEVFTGRARFSGPNALVLESVDGLGEQRITAQKIMIATGTEATRDPHIPFDGRRVLISDDILSLDELPRSLTVIGAGVIGCEYASIFATLGTRVTLVDKRDRLLPFVDGEIVDTLAYHLRENRVTMRLNESVAGVELVEDESGEKVRIHLESGKQIVSDKALYSIGRTGNTAALNLEKAGLKADERGRIAVDASYKTSSPDIYAVGDVIGFPSLASTSMEQGRVASCYAFGVEATSVPGLFPYGIYTIPEISMVGATEEELTHAGIAYEVGKARYREIARGQIIGDTTGLLKLLFECGTHKLLGVHIIGEGASELVHIGQAVLAFGGKVDYFVEAVFNYPTLAECYKTAAFDGLNRLGHLFGKTPGPQL
ncbi:MAG TPA: Si-specific NAD(P)(+) transhydrogenase [Bryobacteraceae bacterium]|nr:Si-specific NAD(P)(+) transhydrogenase [Bryobacteraceae bacterium]